MDGLLNATTPTSSSYPTPTSTPTLLPTPTIQPGGGSGTIDYGSLYGDLYVILRDVNGVPILDEFGCIQPISTVTGEPFQLLTDPALDILCELTEEMSTWVESVDFGRLNLGRAPDAVLFHAFDEAINLMNSASAFDLDPAGRIMMLISAMLMLLTNAPVLVKVFTDLIMLSVAIWLWLRPEPSIVQIKKTTDQKTID